MQTIGFAVFYIQGYIARYYTVQKKHKTREPRLWLTSFMLYPIFGVDYFLCE